MSMKQVDDLQLELESYFIYEIWRTTRLHLIKIDSMLTVESLLWYNAQLDLHK